MFDFNYFGSLVERILNDKNVLLPLVIFLFGSELVLNLIIISNVPYTEIDWKAYMQQVESVSKGVYDYSKLEGGTGPLVYPAGFVYIYWILYQITDGGRNILFAQYIFLALYLATFILVLIIYSHSKKVPPWTVILLCISYRIHSIYVLRLFNDCFAVFFLYLALLAALYDHWTLACFLYSVAVSVKMNILLYVPGLCVLLVKRFDLLTVIPKLVLCAVVQIVLGLPFLLDNPLSYVTRAFNFGRKFLFVWTVNWKFLPEDVFVSSTFAVVLLAFTLLFWGLFLRRRWLQGENIKSLLCNFSCHFSQKKKQLDSDYIMSVLFESNFVGIVFSRTLHFQFYVWYYHTLPYLLWQTQFPTEIRVMLFCVIEMMWNVFPTQMTSSFILQLCHLIILISLLLASQRKTEKERSCAFWRTLVCVLAVLILGMLVFGPRISKLTQKVVAFDVKEEL